MKCEVFTGDLVDFVDGELEPARQHDLERHLEGCDVCRALVADLRAIRAAAFTLDRLEPSPHVWAALQARLANEPPPLASVLPWRNPVAWRPWLAAAATLLLATALGIWSLWRPAQPPSAADRDTDIAPEELVASVEADLQAAEAHYEKAIQGLEQIARSDNDALDPAVAAVLQKNLQVIDQAIGESRAAIRSQPTSANAQESLFDAMRNKVALLQQTVELINEMRKGNQAEAGRIMQGLKEP
jgi:anti-sigma factor RsiW